jgi:hypothetical protein
MNNIHINTPMEVIATAFANAEPHQQADLLGAFSMALLQTHGHNVKFAMRDIAANLKGSGREFVTYIAEGLDDAIANALCNNKSPMTIPDHEIEFMDQRCVPEVAFYGNGRAAIKYHARDGEPMGTLTVNLPDAELGEDEIAVKTWSENECLAEAVLGTASVKATIFEDTGRRIPTDGHGCEAQVWKVKS